MKGILHGKILVFSRSSSLI